MLKVGFVSYWFERGQAYVTKNVIQAIESDCEVFVFARADNVNPIGSGGEWDIPNLWRHEQYHIPHDSLRKWILLNDIDLVFFNEEYDFALVGMVKRMGVATMGIYYWELFNPEYVAPCNLVYDAIICPTAACFKRFGELGVKNIHHVKWGVDLNVFKPSVREPNDPVRFFHPAGWGGMHGRRGTDFVLEAFGKMEWSAELLIHTQHENFSMDQQNGVILSSGTASREELIAMYQESDAAILPSKWEGLGLTFLEAVGCGLPIITVDAPPMNEFMDYGETADYTTGFCCNVSDMEEHQDIFVNGMIPDVDDLARRMDLIANRATLEGMRKATMFRRSEWDWKVNSLPLRDLILELGENAVGKKGKTGKSAELDNITALIQGKSPDADTRQYARFNKILADPMLKGRVLDVGCKHGTLTMMLAENFDATGVDKDTTNIEVARQIGESKESTADFYHDTIDALRWGDETFDTVILAQVLEHVEDPADLKELMRVLKPDGCLIITTNVGFAHWDPDHEWFFFPDATYEMMRGGWCFVESGDKPAFMNQGGSVPFGAFIEKYFFDKAYGYQVYNNHESEFFSYEIYARVYKSEATLVQDFPVIDGDEIIESTLLYSGIIYEMEPEVAE